MPHARCIPAALVPFAAALLLMVPAPRAATLAAADAMGGYSGKVLQRVAPHWRAPAGPAGRMVQVRVRIASDGGVMGCEPAGDTPHLDLIDAACSAVSRAGRMPVPDYGMSGEVYLTFMTDAALGGTPAAQDGDPYAAQVMAKVRLNWSPPIVEGERLVRVRLRVGDDGRVLDFAIDASSGQPEVDAAALRAVAATGTLPVPPPGAARDIVLTFTVRGGQ